MAAGRKVRLVCAFTTSLVRTRLDDVLSVIVEAQAFCIRFSRVRCALFRGQATMRSAGDGGSGMQIASSHATLEA
jgi:CCR4-NOT transcription complex subunit 11